MEMDTFGSHLVTQYVQVTTMVATGPRTKVAGADEPDEMDDLMGGGERRLPPTPCFLH